MPLKLDGEGSSLFSHNRDFREGVKERGIRPGQATVVVAQDGSGDAESIQEGIDMLPAGGGTVYIKKGLYLLTKKIIIPSGDIELIGSGRGTEIKTDPAWTEEDDTHLIDGSANTKGIYRDLYFNIIQPGVGAVNGIDLGDNSIVGNCWFASGPLAISVADNCSIIQNQLINGSVIWVAGDNNTLTGNILSNSGRILMYFADRNCIIGNVINGGAGDGIWVQGNRNVLIGNTITGKSFYGIKIISGMTNNLIIGNMLDGNTLGAVIDAGTNTQPNGAMGTNNLAFDDLNMIT